MIMCPRLLQGVKYPDLVNKHLNVLFFIWTTWWPSRLLTWYNRLNPLRGLLSKVGIGNGPITTIKEGSFWHPSRLELRTLDIDWRVQR